METTKSNTGVNSLPNRIKFAGCLEIDVNGKYVKDITTPRVTAKSIWAAAIKAAKDGVKVDGVNDVAICVHLNGLYIGTVFATKEGRKINVTPDICQSAVRFLVKGIEEEKQATPTTPETETTTNTESTMTTTDNVTITIDKDDCNLYTAKANGVPVGSVNTWLNNTFAACYAVGVKQRKVLAMPELSHEDNAAHNFMSESNAVLWLGDMLVKYFSNNGVNAKVVNA